jgi:ribosomal protein S18 acetylase RimI-like enzyme
MPRNEEVMRNLTIEEDDGFCICDHTTYVARTNNDNDGVDTILGSICVKRKTWFLTEIKDIKVAETYRRLGIASEMIKYIIENYIKTTVLYGATVLVDNEAGISLLVANGFSIASQFINRNTNHNIYFMNKVNTAMSVMREQQQEESYAEYSNERGTN